LYASIHSSFDAAAARFGPNIAIDGPHTTVTYTQLCEAANKVANRLLEAGAQKGDLVCVLAEDTIAVVTAILGALKAGCAFVPLDVRAPLRRQQAMLAQARCKWYLAERHTVSTLETIVRQLGIKHARVLDLSGGTARVPEAAILLPLPSWSEASNADPGIVWGPDDLAYVYFTSGSTGVPKGIAGRAKAIPHFVEWEIRTFGFPENVRVSQFTTPAFDAALRDYFVPLCSGGTVCVPTADLMSDAERLTQWIEDSGIQVIHCVPSLFRVIAQQSLRAESFPALRFVLMAGEALLPSDVQRWTAIFGERIPLVNMYGPSETTMIKFFHVVTPSDARRPFIPIGKPMDGAASLVLDENRRACPPGVIGEIYIRTPYRSLGYFNQPEMTAEVFVQNPVSDEPEDLVYRTGDLGRILPDGSFEFLGRKDQQVKIRGARVELSEVENTLRLHPAIEDVAVVDVDSARGFKTLCAYVVRRHSVDVEGLREFVTSFLPEYMIPSAFVFLAELPRSLNGKVDRRGLPPPDKAAPGSQGYVSPRTPVQERLTTIWEEVFGFQQIGINDDFFQLGGHSLLVMQVLSRVRVAFNVEVPLRRLFEARTIAEMAELVTEATISAADSQGVAALVREIEGMSDEQVDEGLEQDLKNVASGGR
jgi:amino acid adenylation domain-containing protein